MLKKPLCVEDAAVVMEAMSLTAEPSPMRRGRSYRLNAITALSME